MILPAEKKDLNEAVMEVGKGSLTVIQQFLSGRVSKDDLSMALAALPVREVMSEHWEELTSNSQCVPHWKILQTLQGLIDELGFQLGEYGEATLHEDVKEIAINMKLITEQEQKC
ncbi:MAG: hypothetical protein BWY80_01011 [Firmicutes bacterium ADurb.Bin456]|nr:MAG: hypothetical protein BWY80_01011 [Firmicutes bacterium ADurb.Bin456]